MRRARLAAQLAAVLVVVWFAARALAGQWHALTASVARLDVRWWPVVAASLIMFAAYALLIALWRLLLAATGYRIAAGQAARVWLVSSLGRYVPGKVWQLGAMGVMLQRDGVPVVTATAVALLNVLINTVAGFAVLFATGADTLALPQAAVAVIVLLAVGLLLAPLLLPPAAALFARATHRRLAIERLPASAVWLTAGGGVLQWCLYGVAFRLFSAGILGHAAGPWSAWIAAFTGSYLIGFLALFAPGGLVVRELLLAASLTRLGLASAADATVLAVTSRLWLTVLEITPGLLLLLLRRPRPVNGPAAPRSDEPAGQPSRASRMP